MTTTSLPTTANDIFTRQSLFIGGRWVNAAQRQRIDIVDPFTEQVIGSVPRADASDADEAIAAAVQASKSSPWLQMSFRERGEVLHRIGDELEARNGEIVEAYVHDLGGLRAFGPHITRQAAGVFREHLRFAEQLADSEWRENGGERNLIVREPAGPVLAIVPWNAPLSLAAVKIAPALLAGCPVVVKVAPEDPIASFVLADAIQAAGVPEGMVSFLPAGRSAIGDIAKRPEFAHIAFTGSTSSGVQIMRSAAENITAVTLELGGKSAGIFLDDAEPAECAPLVVVASLAQSGQVCTTYSRLLVPESRKQEWIDTLVATFEGLKIGDPDDESTTFGPLVTDTHRATVESYIEIARGEGATVLTGGKRPESQITGYFVEPTLLTDVTNNMRIVQEEVFGPVITLQTYQTLDEAVELANCTDFGLAAGIFTADVDQAIAIAHRIEAGAVAINNFAASVIQPFGGYKKSGLGREGGLENVESLMEIKQIRMPMTAPAS